MLSAQDIRSVMTWDRAIEALRDGHRGERPSTDEVNDALWPFAEDRNSSVDPLLRSSPELPDPNNIGRPQRSESLVVMKRPPLSGDCQGFRRPQAGCIEHRRPPMWRRHRPSDFDVLPVSTQGSGRSVKRYDHDPAVDVETSCSRRSK
jgi:hypothetical protein